MDRQTTTYLGSAKLIVTRGTLVVVTVPLSGSKTLADEDFTDVGALPNGDCTELSLLRGVFTHGNVTFVVHVDLGHLADTEDAETVLALERIRFISTSDTIVPDTRRPDGGKREFLELGLAVVLLAVRKQRNSITSEDFDDRSENLGCATELWWSIRMPDSGVGSL